MTYRLKTIRYQNRDVSILLQNENGPCPLLAASNCLLLRGAVSLAAATTNIGMATLDDIANMLANHAMTLAATKQRQNSNTMTNDDDAKHPQKSNPRTNEFVDDDVHGQFCLNELMQYIPKFQYGMDVNPRFTAGCHGYEFTAELNVLCDMLECPLVHGWLLDPFVALSDGSSGGGGNDEPMTTSAAIGSLTYNEVMDRVILGQEASLRLQQLHTQIEELRLEHPALFFSNDDTNFSDPISNNNYAAAAATNNLVAASQKYAALKRQEHEAQVQATAAHLMEQFLAESSHQLTLYGLEMLHSTLKEHELCVFFRNNHYGTITKHSDGLLYLLVTDLGYADTPSIVWEKLDVVDGDTEFCNSQFGVCHPGGGGGGGNSTPLSPPTTTTPATTTHPMQVETTTMTTTNMGMKMLPSSNQGDDDYRLALELSRYENQQSATPPPRNRRRDDADDRTLHDSSSKQPRPNNAAAPPSLSSLPAPTMVAIPGKATAATTQIHNTNASTTVSRIEVGIPVMNSSQINQQQQQQQLTSAHFKHETRFESSRQEAADRILALQLQQETPDNNETSTTLSQANNTIDTVCMGDHDDPRSLQLARQLQQEEDRQVASLAAANDRNRPAGNNSNYNTTTTTIAPPNRKTAAAAQTNVCAIM